MIEHVLKVPEKVDFQTLFLWELGEVNPRWFLPYDIWHDFFFKNKENQKRILIFRPCFHMKNLLSNDILWLILRKFISHTCSPSPKWQVAWSCYHCSKLFNLYFHFSKVLVPLLDFFYISCGDNQSKWWYILELSQLEKQGRPAHETPTSKPQRSIGGARLSGCISDLRDHYKRYRIKHNLDKSVHIGRLDRCLIGFLPWMAIRSCCA